MAERGITGDDRRRAVRQDEGVRQLRLPRVALGVVRLPRVRVVVDQVPRAGGVLRGVAQRPADGVLVARTRSCRTPAATGWWCARPTSTPRWRRRTLRAVRRRRTGGVAVRLGIGSVRGIGSRSGRRRSRRRARPTDRSPASRTSCAACRRSTLAQLEAMATAGLFGECFGLDRREALWAVGAAVAVAAGSPAGHRHRRRAAALPGMTPVEEAVADLWATGVSPDGHPTQFLRDELGGAGRASPPTRPVGRRARQTRCSSPGSSPTASGR